MFAGLEEKHANAGIGFDSKADTLAFAKSSEDGVDMKLDFACDSDLFTQLTEDKANKAMALPRSMHSTISPSSELDFRIASVKKVWEMPPLLEQHGDDSGAVSTGPSYSSTFGNAVEPALDPSTFAKSVESPGVVTMDDSAAEVAYR